VLCSVYEEHEPPYAAYSFFRFLLKLLLQQPCTSMPAAMNSIQHEDKVTARSGADPAGEPVTIAVVEDSPIMRRNLSWWLDQTPGLHRVCACADGAAALRAIPKCRPQVVLMDIQMPGMSGVECTAQLKQLLPSVQIIVLTVYEDTGAGTRCNAHHSEASWGLVRHGSGLQGLPQRSA
jgi:CheY-like chemotaxis protein